MIKFNNNMFIGLAVVAVLITGVLIYANSSTNESLSFLRFGNMSKEAVAQKALDHLNNNILEGQTATLGDVSIVNGVVKMQVKIAGTTYDSYATRDGKLFFPEAFMLESTTGGQNNTGGTTFNITDQDHVRGPADAKVTLVEYSDFECPFCEKVTPTIEKIMADYDGKVRLVYRHYPLTNIHPNAQKAAEASECASEQGKFWEYYDILFKNQPTGFSLEKFKKWAADLKLNTTQFNSCLDSSKYAARVKADVDEGSSKGVTGTPATFVNGELVSGAQPYDTFKQKIDAILSATN